MKRRWLAEHACVGLGCLLDSLGRHVQVGDGATGVRAHGVQQHAFLPESRDEGRRRELWATYVEKEDVRFHCGGIDRDRRNLRKPGRQPLGMRMVFRIVLRPVADALRGGVFPA